MKQEGKRVTTSIELLTPRVELTSLTNGINKHIRNNDLMAARTQIGIIISTNIGLALDFMVSQTLSTHSPTIWSRNFATTT